MNTRIGQYLLISDSLNIPFCKALLKREMQVKEAEKLVRLVKIVMKAAKTLSLQKMAVEH